MTNLNDALAARCASFAKSSTTLGNGVAVSPEQLLERDASLGLSAPSLWSPNRHCRMIKARDGWLAVSLARDDDMRAVPAWTGCALDTDPWAAISDYVAHTGVETALADALMLHLPVSRLGEASAPPRPRLRPAPARAERRLKAVDLSALWAGPLCGGLLAQSGVDVLRVESPTRPDPTAISAPMLHARMNGQKRSTTLALSAPSLRDEIAAADVLITSGRPHALARHGLDEAGVFRLNPNLIWVAITAHGWHGAGAMRVGFGDDCAAGGGLVKWQKGIPHFIGDALADPLTGLEAAIAVADALGRGEAGLLNIALAHTAADYATRLGLR